MTALPAPVAKPPAAPASASPGEAETLVARLGRTIDEIVDPLLAPPGPIALLDFPNHENAGDSAIWLGELAFLQARGALPRVRYRCTLTDFRADELARRVGRGTVFIHGGGNLGDLWEEHQAFRERLLDALPHNPVVQLPQSIHFKDERRLARAREVFDRHPDFTILVRDRPSLEFAEANFTRARVALCPDMAFCLGALPRPAPPAVDVLWLLRTDHESATPESEGRPGEPVDWIVHMRSTPLARRHRRLRRRLQKWPWARPLFTERLTALADRLARERLDVGTALLSRGARVVTDRLHGHILCELLGIPHAMIDNSYGKLSRFHATWTRSSRLATMCSDRAQALAWAQRSPRDE